MNKLKTLAGSLNNRFQLNNGDNILNLALLMLLVIFLVYMKDNGYLSIFMPVILIPGLLFSAVRQNKFFWLLVSLMGCTFYLVLDLVGYVPNHKHIFAYVILAVTLSMFIKEKVHPLDFMKHQSKIIIGLCFLFATTGKFMAPEFLNGSFFEFTNTTDPRFFGFSTLIGGVDMHALQQNEANLNAIVNTINPLFSFPVNGVEQIHTWGFLISYWTIFIEGMIAISFCLPSRFLIAKYRNVFLVTFIITTYPIATVTGFAIILTALGFIQSVKDNKLSLVSYFYLAVYVLLPLNLFPFTRLLAFLS